MGPLNEQSVDEAHALTDAQRQSFEDNGYVLLKGVFEKEEIDALQEETERLLGTYAASTGNEFFANAFATDSTYDPDDLEGIDLKVLYNLEGYSTIYSKMITDPRLVTLATQLIGPNVEFHLTSLHAKPPERGAPFPMHQDSQFFIHENDRYLDFQIHVDDAPSETGPLQFIDGSHKEGTIPHVFEDGEKYIPADTYSLKDATEVPAEAGDVIIFHIDTVHGSDINRSDRFRPLVRVGYRDPTNRQLSGPYSEKATTMVAGTRSDDRLAPGSDIE